jgi:hypothetical protein
MQVISSNLTSAMDQPPQRLARRSLIRSLAIGAAAIMLLFSASGQMVQAADGGLDPTFGTGGQVITDFNRSNDLAYGMALQPDGKVVVAGIKFVGNNAEGVILRSRDTTRMALSTPPLGSAAR